MPTYVITGKSAAGAPQVAVSIDSISQEGRVIEELDLVNAVRAFLLTADGVGQAVAQKYEQVITIV